MRRGLINLRVGGERERERGGKEGVEGRGREFMGIRGVEGRREDVGGGGRRKGKVNRERVIMTWLTQGTSEPLPEAWPG